MQIKQCYSNKTARASEKDELCERDRSEMCSYHFIVYHKNNKRQPKNKALPQGFTAALKAGGKAGVQNIRWQQAVRSLLPGVEGFLRRFFNAFLFSALFSVYAVGRVDNDAGF